MNREGTLLITGEVRWGWVMWRTIWLLGLPLAACTHQGAGRSLDTDPPDASTAVCLDHDGDGFGEHCKAGADCNDHDPSVHEHCMHCATPEEGCACEKTSVPLPCYLDKTSDDAGAIMCHEGTRFCRNALWSACEDVHDFPLPDRGGATTALVGAPSACSDCDVNCFSVSDQLFSLDGGVGTSGSNVSYEPGGGLTLGVLPTDAGPPPPPPPPPPPCTLGVGPDLDCDGIPNEFDPYPNDPPFATANPTIFLNIPPAQTGTGAIDLTFKVTSADVYFLVDQTASMDQERDKLKSSLTTGDYINNAAYQCSDFDFDHVPNNEQKSKGIIGAIRCMIRDANFGVGLFREIPFPPTYAATDNLAFANYSNISSDVDGVIAAVNRLNTVGNIDWPEDDPLALHQVLTGGGMYFGVTKRAIPKAICPDLTWGYPCFRTGAIPIILMFTDAQMHNGPDSGGGGTFDYSATLPITAGTDTVAHQVTTNNDTFDTAFDVGDVTNIYTTFTGDSSTLNADLSSTYVPCLSTVAGSDAMFKFELTTASTVKVESSASTYDTVLSLYTGAPGPLTALGASSNGNDLPSNATALGQLYNSGFNQTGSTAAMSADLQWSEAGCAAATAGRDAVYKFDLANASQVQIDTIGSSFDTVLGLFSAAPVPAPAFTVLPNTNEEYISAQDLGNVYNKFVGYSGDTTAMLSNYTNAQVGCNAYNTSPDAAFTFSLSTPTKVRISSEGSAIDTVLGLYSGSFIPTATSAVANTNEDYTTAYNTATLDGRILKLTGSTTGMAANYFASQVGCNADGASPDAVFKFHLNTPRSVQIDTIGTTWDSVLGLYNQAPDTTTHVSITNTNEAFATAYNIGTVNAQDILISGGNTTGMAADFTTTADPCATASSGVTAPDAAYRFKLTSPTTVKLDLTGASFKSTIALQPIPPIELSSPLNPTNDTLATAISVGDITGTSFQRTGDTSSLTHNYNFTGTNASARDAVFKFTINSAKTVQIDTAGTPFDTVLGLYNNAGFIPQPAAASTNTTGITTANNLQANAINLGTMDDAWKVMSGTTTSDTNDWSDTTHSCTAATSPDVYFKFTLATARTINMALSSGSFSGARYMVYSGSLAVANYVTSCGTSTTALNLALGAGTYYVVVKGASSANKGSYDLTVKDVTAPIATNDDVTAGVNTTSLITSALAAGTYVVVLSAATNTYGAFTIRFRDKTYWDSYLNLTCNTGSTNNSAITYPNLPAGDYGIIVKGKASTNYGTYNLRVSDTIVSPSPPGVLQCDDNSGGGVAAKITANSLPAGDYWLILKGTTPSAAGAYTVTLQDASVTVGNLLQCDDDGGEAPTSLIERDLTAGNYQVIVKGKTSTAKGAYKLSVRDVTNIPINRLGCDNDSGGSLTSKLVTNLAAGSYYVTVKGKTAATSGAYTLSVRDLTNHPATSTACNNNDTGVTTSKLTAALTPGTYYVALKGATATDNGPYQLSLGTAATVATNYVPPTWAQTLKAVQDSGVHVISILSCHDDPTYGNASGNCNQLRTQANTLATASKALGASNNKLVFDIDKDGTGLSNTVVTAVSQLANYLVMNVTVRVLFEPDDNPGFITTVQAIDELGDGCSGLVGIEHQNCLPGASPRFLINFKNPANAPVPLNPLDPKGGYNFRAQLIGNKQFIVDEIPIYIIPEAVPPSPVPPPNYYPTGQYQQDVTASTCDQTQTPDWNQLTWEAEVYANTSITFNMCTASTTPELATCTAHQIVKVSGVGACASDTDCAKGYCDTTIGVCQVVTGTACSVNQDCVTNAYCDTSTLLCTYTSEPVYMGTALGADRRKPYMRMQVALAGTAPITQPPVLHTWSANYLCRGAL